jgi:4-amino-4-deoxychorismate lyase
MPRPDFVTLPVDAWLNGQPQSRLSIHDRGLQYGDGFFTTISVFNQQVFNWPAHWRRIELSCSALNLPLPNQVELKTWLAKAITAYLTQNKAQHCVLKITLTRGLGGVGYQMPGTTTMNCLFLMKPSPFTSEYKHINASIEATLCQTKASITDFAGLKTLNRLENVIARTEIANQGYAEGIMLNHKQQVICGTQSNLFMIKGKTAYTPKLELSGVEGTTRYQLMKLFPSLGYQIEETELSMNEIHQADELFFCNAVRSIQPVSKLLNSDFDCKQTHTIQQAWSQWQLANAIPIEEFNND